jgi:UDP-N-acetylglucosamine acyltransferase
MDGTHTVRGINIVGLRRHGFSRESIRALRNAFSRLFRKRVNLRQAVAELRAETEAPDVLYLLDFIEQSKRGVCFGPKNKQTEEPSEE